MTNFFYSPAIRSYKIGKAMSYIRKAETILDETDSLNAKTEQDFKALTEYCNWLLLNLRKDINHEFEEIKCPKNQSS